MNKLVVLVFVLFFGKVQAQEYRPEIHCKHFFYGYPYGTPKTNDLLIRESYALSNNDDTKFADWVAYKMDTFSIKGSGEDRKWKADPWLEDKETLEPNDYEDANTTLKTDRGHQVPLGSVDGYLTYFEANYLSNITPQKSNLNQGVWKYLEDLERKKIEEYSSVIVYSGPLYERKMPDLPKANESHSVPSGYWKIVFYENENKQIFTAAFIFDQEVPRDFKLENGYTSIREIEKRTHLDFLWLLEEEKQKIIEEKVMRFSDWK